ncbi:Heavy metal tolerance protein [Daldinia childiae]|uniref:Heavy metal tolerance protein n=1 Tax=Daldinia childiae TaxID=326645 RepID=UPI00144594EF|nr:Heavy metal tolerance protein [Daldinia childiae]KAF3065088.1 Heavy metal tolerance protein [Daldinia childiae]
MAEVIINPPDSPAERVRDVTQYLYPDLLLLVFIVIGATHSVYTAMRKNDVVVPTIRGPGGKPLPVTKRRLSDDDASDPDDFSPHARRFFQCSMVVATLTFLATGGAIAARALIHRSADGEHGWWCGEPKTVFVLGSAFLYVYLTLTMFDWKSSPSLVHILTWSFALVGEIIIFVCDAVVLSRPHKVMVNLNREKYVIVDGIDKWDMIDLGLSLGRIAILVGMILVYYTIILLRNRAQPEKYEHGQEYDYEADESTPLLNGEANGYRTNGHASHPGANGAANGNANGNADASHPMVDEDAGFYRPEKLPHTTWFEYLRGYSVFFPYMWPNKQLRLQIIVVVCFVLLVLQRMVNIMVPYQIGAVTNQLSGDDLKEGEKRTMPWLSLGLLIVYKLLQGPSGLLGSLRSLLWIPVSQHTYRALTTSAFEHVHSLSLDFHLGKRTGEVLSALNKGSSVNSFLEQVTFQVFPMLIDLFVAVSYFYVKFDAVYAVIVCAITFYYLFLTIRMASKTADQRRAMSNADREEEAVKNDSIISYETVKYFNAEDFEFNRYREAINNFQVAEAKVTWSISTMNICQSLVFMIGMLVTMMLGAYQVTMGNRKVGDFVTLMIYLGQLQGPLNFFGTFYRTVQQAMISGERLLELFKQRPTVVNRPGAVDVTSCEGRVEFSKVKFAYDKRKPALRNLTFTCEPGTTTALVGESGGGKSTLFRLMYRYFNCQEGNIKVDGRDIKDVTIDSVRRYIGVVPQDTVLFNDTLMYNLRYANQNATDEDIFAACQAASIHERIMSFPDGYNTKVGERGLRLSGGEKQRVAIARTLLKNPKIIMLDEATSALDSHTEQQIQSRLATIGRGRTLLIIAHRLSTITHADQILVLHQGTIVEKGTHDKLLELNGRYASMWNRQAKAEKAAEDARNATRKAEKLLRKANIPAATGDHHSRNERPNNNNNDDSSSSSDESVTPGRHGGQSESTTLVEGSPRSTH